MSLLRSTGFKGRIQGVSLKFESTPEAALPAFGQGSEDNDWQAWQWGSDASESRTATPRKILGASAILGPCASASRQAGSEKTEARHRGTA